MGDYEGHKSPVQRQEPQHQLGHESHRGSASDATERAEADRGKGTIRAVLVRSPYPSVSSAGRWRQRGSGQGHACGCP